MKAFLLHRDRDTEFAPALRDDVMEAITGPRSTYPGAIEKARRTLADERARRTDPSPHETVEQDLGLEVLWRAMAAGDPFIYETARRCMLTGLNDRDAIVFRQRILQDSIANADAVRDLYGLALEALDNERTVGPIWRTAGVGSVVHRSVTVLARQLEVLRRLRGLAARSAGAFRSEGFTRFFRMIEEELGDDYLAEMDAQLNELGFRYGVLQTGGFGRGLKASRYIVCWQHAPGLRERLGLRRRSGRRFVVHPRDEAGLRALEDIRARGLAEVAGAVAQAADHVRDFFTMLRLELGFYLGGLNLYERLSGAASPCCFPVPLATGRPGLEAEGLYDLALSLHTGGALVGNDVQAPGRPLIVLTGANQGGKSTLLRAIGIAQLMMQSGLVVGARAFTAEVCEGVHTHFKREEDARMEGGKLDEELRRMAAIAQRIAPRALLLCNESFSSTNEREGSEIARGVLRAMLDRGVRVALVTHMYDLAHGLAERTDAATLFLRAERLADGRRTFRLVPGEPLATSYAADSYRRIFGEDPRRAVPLEL